MVKDCDSDVDCDAVELNDDDSERDCDSEGDFDAVALNDDESESD